MSKHHEEHPEYGAAGVFAGYGESDHRTTEAPEQRSGHPGTDDAASRIRVRRLDTRLRNKWEAQVDKRPVGRAASCSGAMAIALAHLERKP